MRPFFFERQEIMRLTRPDAALMDHGLTAHDERSGLGPGDPRVQVPFPGGPSPKGRAHI
jgi:hypothetical protein